MDSVIMEQKFISMTFDFIEEQRSHMHKVVDEYVDMVMDVRQNQASGADKIQPSFSEVYDKLKQAIKFLSLKCEEMKCETLSFQTSKKLDVIIKDEFTHQCKNLQVESHVDKKARDFLLPSSFKPAQHESNAGWEEFSRKNKMKTRQQKCKDALCEGLERQLQNVLAKQGDLEKKLDNKFADFRKEIDGLSNEVRLVSCFFNNGDVLEDFSEKLNSLELTTAGQSERIDKIDETLQSITESQQKNDLLVQRMDDTQALLTKGQDDLIKVKKQFEKVEINHKTVCQLLVCRLKPLEQLRKILNSNLTQRDINIKQLHSVAAELAEISKRVNQLKDSKCTTHLTGFTAEAAIHKGIKANSIIGPFISNNCNSDVVQFVQSSGIFTASVGGVYMACIHVYHQDCSVSLMHSLRETASKSFNEYCVFVTKTAATDTNVCRMGLIEMKKGDILYTRTDNDNIRALKMVRFFCYRIA